MCNTNQQCNLDKDGYLLNYADWSENIAYFLAEQEKIDLTPSHWEIIYFVREFYQQYKTSPSLRILIKALESTFGQEKMNSRYLHQLFPEGVAKQVTKLAGLPKPVKCL